MKILYLNARQCGLGLVILFMSLVYRPHIVSETLRGSFMKLDTWQPYTTNDKQIISLLNAINIKLLT